MYYIQQNFQRARKKNGREFLYQLGIELVMPEIFRRRRSNSFRYLSKDLRDYIDSLLKKKCVSRTDEVISATILESSIPVPSSVAPESSSSLEPSAIYESFSVPDSFTAQESLAPFVGSLAAESSSCVTSIGVELAKVGGLAPLLLMSGGGGPSHFTRGRSSLPEQEAGTTK